MNDVSQTLLDMQADPHNGLAPFQRNACHDAAYLLDKVDEAELPNRAHLDGAHMIECIGCARNMHDVLSGMKTRLEWAVSNAANNKEEL